MLTGANRHVAVAAQHGVDEIAHPIGGVGVVGVDHDVDVGLDPIEGVPKHVTLPLAWDPDDHGARGFRLLRRSVG
jgi:hypothetical protein